MPSARDIYREKPSQDEIADVLGQRVAAAVGTKNEDGSVHLAYVLFLHVDGLLYFETSSTTRKARNVARNGSASLLVQGTAASGRHLMVAVEGEARLLQGSAASEANRRLRAKYIRPEALDAVDRAWSRFDDVAIEIAPGRWRSWTGGLLHAATEEELGMPYDDAWIDDD